MTRLRETCFKGDKLVTVYPGLDWTAGDQVSLLPTATQWTHTDYMTIESYDTITGVVTFTESLKYYHWGQISSTESTHSGVDMRGEVILLTRNVRVVGNDTDSWGAMIVTSDSIETNGVQRTGQVVLDNIECYNCTQRNTMKAGIRFENALLGKSTVTNSVVWGGLGWSFAAMYSKNVFVQHSYFIGSRQIGVAVIESSNITLDYIVTADTKRRPEAQSTSSNMVDVEACVTACALWGPQPDCYDVHITNSISAGCIYAGFVAPGHDCGMSETQDNFRNNVAHSSDMGGAYIIPDVNGDNHAKCYEGSHFAAYKVGMTGVSTHFISQEIRMSNMVMIDNTLGANLLTQGEAEYLITGMRDSDIYGSTGSDDCPENHDCWCQRKFGISTFGGNTGGKLFHIEASSPMPMQHIMSYGAWNPETDFYQVNFHNWEDPKQPCGAYQSIMGLIKDQSDYVPTQRFYKSEFVNVHQDAIAWIMDPSPGWNNVDDCIGFPCTAPSNVVFDFQKSSYSGSPTPKNREEHMTIIADTPGASESFDNCEFNEIWNGWECKNKYIGQLCWIAQDDDWEDRSPTPIFVTDEDSGYTNKVNHMMDHMWDGFYTGQKHKSQYTAMIQTDRNYTIEYSGTPWKDQLFEMRADEGQSMITIQYWNSLSIRVYADGELVDQKPFDEDLGEQELLTGFKGCGENRWIALKNRLQFIITPQCQIRLEYFDSIQSNVRMEWTMDEFYGSGGVTSFVDRVSAALGIHASQMKVVAVYTGSVVVDYVIEPDTSDASVDSEAASQQLRAIQKNLNVIVESGDSEVFGAPVLSASTNGAVIIEDPTYNPVQRPTQATAVSSSSQDDGSVTISDEAATGITVAATSVIAIIVVIVVLVLCCFGFGTFIICSYQVSKASKHVSEIQKKVSHSQELKKQGIQNASESQIEMDQQYALPEEIDIDIFSKKREMKANDDNVVADETQRASVSSNRKMLVGDDTTTKLTPSKKKLVRPTEDTFEIGAKLKSVKTTKN